MYVLAFDMGIRNLAFCLADVSGTAFTITDWNNYDLLAGTDSQTASRCTCGGPPSWTDISQNMWCKKCVKAKRVGLIGLPGDTKLTIAGLKQLATKEAWAICAKPKKEDYMAILQTKYLLPYVKPKGTIKTDLITILDAIEVLLDKNLQMFSKASVIRIENQPVFDAPTMKSVQMILFTLLVHRLRKEYQWPGTIVFVHASKKTEEAQEAVDAAGSTYKARKDTAEALVLSKLPEGKWRDYFTSRKKRSDLADALLMCLR
jgi:hypothetical protein